MMDERMKALIDAPLADPAKIHLPDGKRVIRRGPRYQEHDSIGAPKVSREELTRRKEKAAAEKLDKLFDYYAASNLTAEKVAERMGLYRQEQNGVDEAGKPVFVRVLDVKRADEQLSWRRKRSA
jgi:hypothetical protein